MLVARYSYKFLILLVFLIFFSEIQAQLTRIEQEEVAVKIPVGGQFGYEHIKDMTRDEHGVVWVLGRKNLFYVLNEGLFDFGLIQPVISEHIKFLTPTTKGQNQILTRTGLVNFHQLHHQIERIDLTNLLSLNTEKFIRDAAFDENGNLLVLCGRDDFRELWSVNLKSAKAELLQDGLIRMNYLTILPDRVLLRGQGLMIFWRNETKNSKLVELSMESLGDSEMQKNCVLSADKATVYLVNQAEQLITYNVQRNSFELHPFQERVEHCWLGAQNEIVILDKQNQLRDESGVPIFQFLASNLEENDRFKMSLSRGSKGFLLGRETWVSSTTGLFLIADKTSEFELTQLGVEAGRITNVHVDESLNREYVLSASKGLYCYESDSGRLVKHLPLDPKGRKIQGFKFRELNGELFIYGLSGFYKFDKLKEELEFLVDPFLIDGIVLENRFNTFEVHTGLQEVILGTKDNNLIRYNPKTKKETLIPIVADDSESRNLVYEVDILPDGNVMILTEKGFYHLDVSSNVVIAAREIWKTIPAQSNVALSGLKVISDSTMVISSFGDGIRLFDFKKDSVYRPFADPFATADISDVFYDGLEHVYCSSKLGMLSYSIVSNTTQLIQIDKGLPSQNTYYKYMYRDNPGDMVLGLQDSYVRFQSADLASSYSEDVFLRTIQINGRMHGLDAFQDEELVLDYTQNNLQFDVASPIEQRPAQLVYQSRLIGLHDDWRTVSFGEQINYDGLSPGEYLLEIRDINSVKPGRSLKIEIKAPLWKQPWFISLCVLSMALLLFAIYRLRMSYHRKEHELRAKYEVEMAQLEMQSLRAQMNPHFLFNSLNSIKSFIAQNEPRIATRYLTKFSHLIRAILNNSRESMVSLEQEIKALRLYVELEQLRFENSFDFSFDLPEGLDLHSVNLPPLILQPYVENAIWHGLLHKKENRQLSIEIQRDSNSIVAIVRDNGIGRKEAMNIKSKSATKHKSLGMAITADRIRMVQDSQDGLGVEIIDLMSANGEPAGTEVRINIPINKDEIL